MKLICGQCGYGNYRQDGDHFSCTKCGHEVTLADVEDYVEIEHGEILTIVGGLLTIAE